jgi:hypothetical protein
MALEKAESLSDDLLVRYQFSLEQNGEDWVSVRQREPE